MYFCYFVIISALEKDVTLYFNKLEFTSPKNALCQGWLKLAQCFLRRRFFNFDNVFLLFCNYLPLEKDMALYFNKLNPLHPRMLCAKVG